MCLLWNRVVIYVYRIGRHLSLDPFRKFCYRPSSKYGPTTLKIEVVNLRSVLLYGAHVLKKYVSYIFIQPFDDSFVKRNVLLAMLTTDISKYAYSAEETLLTDFLLYIYARKTGALIQTIA